MFYRIAIIQNEKEVFKYDCADWNSLFKDNPNFSFYKIVYFDEHNILNLFEHIMEFDSIFFATNALNSRIIFEACEQNSFVLGDYIKNGKGVYLGYSSKSKVPSFLPEKYRIGQVERDFSNGENEMDGVLFAFSHPLTDSHKIVDLKKYVDIAIHHTTIAGMYFDYLNFKDDYINVYDKVVIDKNNDRVLLVCSKIASGTRIVVSTLPIDWQHQMDFFTNIVKYCTEGEATIKIYSQGNTNDNDFSREYLSRQLNLFKRAFLFENINSFSDVNLEKCRYNTIIFDSTWKDKEIDNFCETNQKQIYNKNIRILHYYNYRSSKNPIYKLTVHSAFQQVDLIEESILIAIEGRTPTSKEKYSYDSSLLSTYEALKLLQENNIYNFNLYENIIKTGKKRLLIDGSYDAMFVASCNFYAVWKLCDPNAISDECFLLLQKYILEELFEKEKNNISPLEKAQFLYFFDDCTIISNEQKCQLLNSIIELLLCANNDDIFSYGISYCWNIFSNNINIALQNHLITERDLNTLIKSLFSLLGDAKRDCKIAVLSNYIIVLSNLLKVKIVSKNDELRVLYKILFNSISQIYDRRKDLLWNDDIYSSCCAIKALKAFSELSTYPIDEILLLSQPNNSMYSLEKKEDSINYTMILESTSHQANELINTQLQYEQAKQEIVEYQKEVNQYKNEIREINKTKNELDDDLQKLKKESKIRKVVDIIGRIAIIGVVFFLVQMFYVLINHHDSFVAYFKSFNSFLSWMLVAISTIITLVTFIRFFKKKK